MTREEKIKRLKTLKARCERLIVSSDRGPEEWRRDAEALDLALTALRPVSREQVVRCRECKHGKRGVDNMVKCSHPCGKVISMTAGDFCSYGQRKESDHEVSES